MQPGSGSPSSTRKARVSTTNPFLRGHLPLLPGEGRTSFSVRSRCSYWSGPDRHCGSTPSSFELEVSRLRGLLLFVALGLATTAIAQESKGSSTGLQELAGAIASGDAARGWPASPCLRPLQLADAKQRK